MSTDRTTAYFDDVTARAVTIGSFPDWSVQAARTAAKKLKQEVDGGRDPMGQRHADRVAPTLQDVWERYEREHLPRKATRAQADERRCGRKSSCRGLVS